MWTFADEPLMLRTATAEYLIKHPWLGIYPGEILEELPNNCKPVKNLHAIFTFVDPAPLGERPGRLNGFVNNATA